jgi:hypothetical protein
VKPSASRRAFVAGALVLLAAPLAAEAQGSTFTFTIPLQRGE